MAGFKWASSGANSAPIKMVLPISETMYEGQMAQWDIGNGALGLSGGVQILDAATELWEDDEPVAGCVVGVYSEDRVYDGTYFGHKCTYSTSQAVVKDTGEPRVEVVLAIPHVTYFKGPIFDAAFGTALTELVVTSADSGGTTVTHANEAITDCADDFGVVYCRSGANRGLYRKNTTPGTGVQVVSVPFPNGIVVGDVFVAASVKIGMTCIDIPATANCIDGNNNIDTGYGVIVQEVNLEESGKEYAVFSFTSAAVSTES